MRRPRTLVILAALIYGGIWFFQHFQLEGLDKIFVRPKTQATATSYGGEAANVPARAGGTVRIASFNIQVFGTSKLAKRDVMEVLAETVRKFDLVAIQEVRSTTDDILPRFVELINSTGRHYDFVIGPRKGRTNSKEQYAFIFDAQTIEVDRGSVYSVNDPDDLFQRPPLVASFRARGPPPNQAFTFTLIDMHTEPGRGGARMQFPGAGVSRGAQRRPWRRRHHSAGRLKRRRKEIRPAQAIAEHCVGDFRRADEYARHENV